MKYSQSGLRKYLAVFVSLWTFVIIGSFIWIVIQQNHSNLEIARAEARIAFQKDTLYRSWVSKHGGVYAPITSETPPNPNLSHIPERDIKTPSGKLLTLINPAYMTRQVFEQADKESDYVKGHITSLKPIRPGNSPDPWEQEALKAFERGEKEVSGIQTIDGQPYLRLMRPFIAEQPCLKCHAAQGYKQGDIRGGISVSVPMRLFSVHANELIRNSAVTHALIWLLGLSVILYLHRNLVRNSVSLQESEEKFRTLANEQSVILETSPAGICMLKNRVVKMSNSTFDSLLGYDRWETSGKNTLEFYPDQATYDYIGAEGYRAFKAGETYNTDIQIRRKDGTLFWANLTGHAVTPNDPDSGSIWIIQDITQRKILEERTARDAARLESLIRISQSDHSSVQELLDNALHEAINLTNSEIGYIYFYNEATRQFTLNSWSKETMNQCLTIEPNTIYDLDKTGLWGEAVRQRKPIMVNDYSAPNPYKKGYPEGHVALHSFLTVPIFAKGSIVAVAGVGNKASDYDVDDINQLTLMMDAVWKMVEQDRLDRARLAAEEKYRALLESIKLIAVVLDTSGNVMFCNDFLLSVTGRSRQEVTGLNWFDTFLPPEHRSETRRVFTETLTSQVASYYENPVICSDGTQRFISWHNTPLYDDEGTVTGIASIGNDLTEQRAVESQLRQAQKMEAIGQLAGGVAHDFNNILQVISGYASLLKMDGKLDVKQQDEIDQILAASDKAVHLTRGLLAFSRKQEMKFTLLDLNDIVENVKKFLVRIIGEDIHLKSSTYSSKLTILADMGQIEQVLINLATNARDAMQKGGVISIETGIQEVESPVEQESGREKPGNYAVMTVSDTGSGMNAEICKRIFEPFFTTKEIGKGTGLGMAIVYGIIKQHNGFINVYSELGYGTTFKIYLPLQEADQVEHGRGNALVAPPQGGNETILLAEDDDAARKLVVNVLTQFGYSVIQAIDGEEAVRKFAEHRDVIDMVLMDLIMPKMNGKEAYDEIKKLRPDMKVLFGSGYTAEILSSRGISEEGVELITKPFHPMELLRKIREIIDRQTVL